MAAKSVKVRWSNYSTETISTLYATSIANELENMSSDDYNRLADSAVLIKDYLLKHSAPLVKPTRKNKKCGKVFIKLPEDVKKARSWGNITFNSRKLLNYPLEGDMKLIVPLVKNTGKNWEFFSTNVKLIMLQSQMKNYFGNLLKVSALHLRCVPLL